MSLEPTHNISLQEYEVLDKAPSVSSPPECASWDSQFTTNPGLEGNALLEHSTLEYRTAIRVILLVVPDEVNPHLIR